jgi:hypothetical protein
MTALEWRRRDLATWTAKINRGGGAFEVAIKRVERRGGWADFDIVWPDGSTQRCATLDDAQSIAEELLPSRLYP